MFSSFGEFGPRMPGCHASGVAAMAAAKTIPPDSAVDGIFLIVFKRVDFALAADGTAVDGLSTTRTAPLGIRNQRVVFEGLVAVCAKVAYFDILLGHGEDIGIQWDADIAEESCFREKFHAVQPLVVLCKNGFSLGLINRSWW